MPAFRSTSTGATLKRPKYEIVTPHPDAEGIWKADTIGLNEPRTLRACRADIRAFRRGDRGLDFVYDNYYIRNVADGSIVRRPGRGRHPGGRARVWPPGVHSGATMKYVVLNDPKGGMAYLTAESQGSSHGVPVLEIRAGDVDGTFGPEDLIYDESGPVMRAASLVELWASSPERSDDEIEAARRFLRQWPDGPQVA